MRLKRSEKWPRVACYIKRMCFHNKDVLSLSLALSLNKLPSNHQTERGESEREHNLLAWMVVETYYSLVVQGTVKLETISSTTETMTYHTFIHGSILLSLSLSLTRSHHQSLQFAFYIETQAEG